MIAGAAVRARRLTKRYGRASTETVALDATDLDLEAGDFVAVTGPSGCGKSTLLNLVGLLDAPSDGALTLCGTRVGRGPVEMALLRRRWIGFLFQDAGLIAGMTARDNIAMPLRYRGQSKGSANLAADRTLRNFDLAALADRRIESLSGGERQRVALMRALAVQPAVLVCDEPTASLDEANSRFVAGALRDYAATGAIVLCSTHDPIVASASARRISMDRGRMGHGA